MKFRADVLHINFIVGLAVFALAAACTPKVTPISAPIQPITVAETTARESWEENWAGVVQVAQKEGTLFAYGGPNMSTARESMQSRFKEKYGITVDTVIYTSATEALRRITAERRAGLKLADIYIGGAATFLTVMVPEGLLEPLDTALIFPEVKDTKLWRNEEILFIDKGHHGIAYNSYVSGNLVVNTNLVKASELTSYQDLMNPKWKGKILTTDPTIPGSGEKFWTVTGAVHKGWDWVREFAARQEPVITRDMRLIMDWVAQGKFAIAIGVMEPVVWEYYQAGAPVSWAMLKDGSYTTVGGTVVGIVKDAPHPNATKVFLNWLLSKEGQRLVTPYASAPSLRLDISTEGLNPVLVPEPGRKYFSSDSEEFTLKYDEFRKLNKEIWSK